MTEPLTGPGWRATLNGSRILLSLTGDWSVRYSGADVGAADLMHGRADLRSIGFETGELGRWDSSLLIFLSSMRQASVKRSIAFDETGLPATVRRLLDLLNDKPEVPAGPARQVKVTERVGTSVILHFSEAIAITLLVGELLLRTGPALRGKARIRSIDLMTCMQDAGVAALPIVTVVNVLIGGILAFVGAVELRRFGADIYIANLVGVAVIREMAAVMTAIVMSGRTGGAYAAQIATMQGSEEIDALRAIGIPVLDYLILPRVAALTAMMPLLYLYGCAVGILGGFAVAVAMLNISPETFVTQTRDAVAGSEVVFGLIKSVVFGAVIAITACRVGMKAGRSASDVGRAATSAVVIGIVAVILLDAVFAVCANALNL